MKNLMEKKLSSQTVFKGKILDVRLDKVLLPNGNEASREVVFHPGAVAVVPVTNDGKVIMVRQFRYPVGDALLELPAGKLDNGERPEDCALRELEEETGYKANVLEKLISFYTTPGFSNEVLHLYLARELELTEQKLDGDEFVAVEFYSNEEIRAKINSNEIKDAQDNHRSFIGWVLACRIILPIFIFT